MPNTDLSYIARNLHVSREEVQASAEAFDRWSMQWMIDHPELAQPRAEDPLSEREEELRIRVLPELERVFKGHYDYLLDVALEMLADDTKLK